ncbi:hypothetical protein [Prosthecomicrobium sp. N25]|uniref:hypothetical protein n=1 Tax=Prosthecomicrobium sp. N25 TaxID=3129254 RepID=UPI003078422A
MARFSIISITASLVLSVVSALPAAAQDVVTVKSGKEEVIFNVYVYGEDCASSGGERITIRTPPANGVARVARIPIRIPPGRACAGQTVKIGVVLYRSRPGFRGTDRVGVDAYMDTYTNGIGETFIGGTVTVQVQ